MNTIEINSRLHHIKNFVGTFARDQLVNLKVDKPVFLVVNTDNSDKPGTHWVAFYLYKSTAEYFDSYGCKPLYDEIYNFLIQNNIKNIVYSPFLLQSIISSTCGSYCILFIKLRNENISYCDFIKLFTNKQIINDINIYLLENS